MAKSKVKRGFFYYLFIFIGFVLGVFCILATILILNPGEDVYGIGIRFVNHSKTEEYYYLTDATETKIHNSDYNKVKFTSNYANFSIAYDSNQYVTCVKMQPSITGLSQSEIINLDISITVANKVLNIEVLEPELWIGFSDTLNIKLILPRNSNFTDIDFDITTKTGAVTFGDQSNKNYEVKSLNVNTESGNIRLSDNLSVKSGNVNLTTKNSEIIIDSNVTKQLNITNETGKIKIDTMSGNLRLTNSNTLEANANKIGGDVYVESSNGYVNINEIGTTIVTNSQGTNNIIGYVDNLPAGSTATGYLYGNFVTETNLDNTNIIIGKMTGNADIESQTGSVTIEKLGKRADITTTSGSIEVKNCYNNIDAKTTSGAITVTQHSTIANTILISDVAKITANFTNLGVAQLTTKGDIEVNATTGLAFKFVYNAKAIEVSWITTELPLSGFVLVSGALATTTTIVTANSENGKVILNDGFVA